jgi:hypothetical protein
MAMKKNSRTAKSPKSSAQVTGKKIKSGEAAAACGESQDRFVKDLLVRGEAQKPNSSGKLPSEATHAITKQAKTGEVKVKRVRFKYF